jgi:phage-related protein
MIENSLILVTIWLQKYAGYSINGTCQEGKVSIEIHRAALKSLQKFPKDVLTQAHEAFRFLEHGEQLSMPLSRPMPSVWPRCHEIRIGDRDGTYRIFYLLVMKDRIFVPHCFMKKTQKTPLSEIAVAKKRIRECLDEK